MRIKLLNIYVDNLTMNEALEMMDCMIQENNCSYVVTPNLDHIVTVEEDGLFKEAYENASLILADGMPLLWIARYIGTPIKEKLSGSDVFPQMCALASHKGYRLFILGGADGVAQKAANNLMRKFPGLIVAGTYSPPMGFEYDDDEVERIVSCINDAKTDILSVALGSPKSEKLIYHIRRRICARLSISIGATVDFEAGTVKRAPLWMSKAGVEWLYRISQDPKRLIGRYWKDARAILPIIKKYKKV